MKRLLPILCVSFLTVSALANEQIRNVQSELKTQGFYYGEVTGNESSELTAAIRRYQIRNGLEVTGSLTAQTLKSLGIEGTPTGQTASSASTSRSAQPPKTASAPTPATKPPVHLRREGSVRDADRRFLAQETQPRTNNRDRSIVPPPARMDGNPVASDKFTDVFAGTPYETAPREVQEQAVRRAQIILTNRGHYDAGVDGDPGPATEEAILSYQRASRLPMTGRLDLETLAQLRLLPGRGSGNPPLRPFNSTRSRSSDRVYRGIWVE